MTRLTRLSIGGMFVLLGGLAVAAVEGGIKFTEKVDEVHKFKSDLTFQLQSQNVKLTSEITTKATKVDETGLVSLQIVSTKRKMLLENSEVPTSEAPALTKILRPDGTLAELHGEGASSEAYRFETLSSVKLPDTALATDKAWTWNVPADAKSGVVKSTIDFKVLGSDKVAGLDVWKISRVVKELTGDSPASDTGTVWISKENGMVVKEADTWTNTPIHGAPSGVNVTVSVELLP